jgi:lipopolysaccharide transport system permease protein
MINSIKEVFAEKDLLLILAKRDITVRYKQTMLGILWAIIRPVATMFVFIFAFKQIPSLKTSEAYPFQLILFSGILIWNYFANSFQAVSNSLLVNSNLISKVYFPRLIIAFSSIAVSLLDLLIGLLVFIILDVYYENPIPFSIIYFPMAILLTTFFSVGLGLILGSYSIKYRDILQIIPIVVQYGFFISPVVYTVSSLLTKTWFNYYLIFNPVVGLIEIARYYLLGGYQSISSQQILATAGSSIVFFVVGLIIFNKREDSFVDHL